MKRLGEKEIKREEKITKVVETKALETKVVVVNEENPAVVKAEGRTEIGIKIREERTKTKRTRL